MTQSTFALPATAVQRAMVALLRADVTLTSLLAPLKGSSPAVSAVADNIPEGQIEPYVRLGDHLSISDNDLTSFGREVTETLHVWTRTRSNGPGQAIGARIAALLDHQVAAFTAALAGSGHKCIRIELEYDQALVDPDPQLRHYVLRFRVITAQLT